MINDGLGLWLRTKPAKGGGLVRSWLFRYQLGGGKKQAMGLGSLHDRSLAEARLKRDELRKLLLEGIDPKIDRDRKRAEQRLANRPVMTFKQAAQEWVDAHEAGWRSRKTFEDWTGMMTRYAFPVLGPLPVAAVNVDMVLQVLKPMWDAGIPGTGSKLRGHVERVLDFAAARELRDSANPARWKTLRNLLPKPSKVRPTTHHEALPFEEVGALMAQLREVEGPAARALEFTILTAARSNESRLAEWSEIDGDVWTIPAGRMKAHVEHRVPLCGRALEILEEMRGLDPEMIFPSHGGQAGLRRALAKLGRTDITVHGFRSTFRDWAGARSNFPREVAEMALAHRIGNATEQAYARHDLFEKRKRLMEAWCQFCAEPKAGVEKVVQLKRA